MELTILKELIELHEKKKQKKDPCWKGYHQLGMKDKGGKQVPNCVPESEELDEKKKDKAPTDPHARRQYDWEQMLMGKMTPDSYNAKHDPKRLKAQKKRARVTGM